ncbi:glycosyltransferase [Arthrobacter sp. B1805]|uniref:glycosyltransferase n=1 Tax=Arthrobacter sp. B1805 TaxID=2058892 RepID=UPI000CE37FCA|nr:glycosyltransferase [Arthrobacter sp. B1805]
MSDPIVVAVVSSYRPPQAVLARYEALARQVAAVVVADDGSGPDAEGVLGRLESLGADVVRRDTNDGIAVTLNAGIFRARSDHGAEWILTLDQDTALVPGYVEQLLATARAALQAGLPVGSVSYAEQNGRPVARLGTEQGFDLAYDPMQSGLLLPVSTLDTVGGLREDLFIDWVDTEFNERVRAAGLLTIVAAGTNLDHSLGAMRRLTVLGRPLMRHGKQLSVAYHPPFRTYYMSRNAVLVARRSFPRHPRWTASRLAHDLIGHAARVVVGPQRRSHLLAMAAGAAHGLRGHAGKIPAPLLQRLS